MLRSRSSACSQRPSCEAIKLVQAIIDDGPNVYMKPGGGGQPYGGGGGQFAGGGGQYGGGGGMPGGGGGGMPGGKPLWETHKSPEGRGAPTRPLLTSNTAAARAKAWCLIIHAEASLSSQLNLSRFHL